MWCALVSVARNIMMVGNWQIPHMTSIITCYTSVLADNNSNNRKIKVCLLYVHSEDSQHVSLPKLDAHRRPG